MRGELFMNNVFKKFLGVSLIMTILGADISAVSVNAALPQLDASNAVALETSINAIVSNMSVDEKANMLVGAGEINGRAGCASATYEMTKFGVPRSTFVDGPIGVSRYGKVTAFPGLNVMASTWDTKLIEDVGKSIGEEAVHYGFDSILGPGIEIQRNPLGGRNADYFSEDPVLTGIMAAAYTNGMQSVNCMADVKHFAANVAETLRERNNSVMSERALRETYLRNYELAVKLSNPGSIMTTYNLINNKFVTANKDILTDILRNEWGYKGIVITDWFAGDGTSTIPALKYEYEYDTIEQITAGVNILMPGGSEGSPIDRRAEIRDWANKGTANMAYVNELCKQILRYVTRTATYKGSIMKNEIDYAKNAAVARKTAADGTVLLKNDSALPIKPTDQVALFGKAQNDKDLTGGGSAAINAENFNTYATIKDGFTNAGIPLNNTVSDMFSISEAAVTSELAQAAAIESGVAVYAVKKTSSEWADRAPDTSEMGYYLDFQTILNIKTVAESFHARGKKLVVVIKSTGPIDTVQWRDYADGIVYIGTGGSETGNALVDVLTGVVNPSGKLAQTFPENYRDIPGSAEFPGELHQNGFFYNPDYEYRTTRHEEGIYVGYKYFTTFNKKTAYPFGYGLSYTNFEYKNAKINSTTAFLSKSAPVTYNGGKMTFEIDVINTGSRAGSETVQLYITNKGQKLETPEIELKTFAKTGVLNPGETQTLTMTVNEELLKYYDAGSASWVIPSGAYEARFGASSEDIREIAFYNVTSGIVVQKVSNKGVLPAKQKLTEITKAKDGGKSVLVSLNDEWKHSSAANGSFVNLGFDDGTWQSSKAPFGQTPQQNGVGAVLTKINGVNYFRKVIAGKQNLRQLIIKGSSAEDTVVYVNGKEVANGENINVFVDCVSGREIIVAVKSSGFSLTVNGITGLLGDSSKLKSTIAAAKAKLSKKGSYTDKSFTALESAYQASLELLSRCYYNQSDVDDKTNELSSVIRSLKDKGAIRDAYDKIMAVSYNDRSDTDIRAEDDSSSVGFASSGKWVTYHEVDFGSLGAERVVISSGAFPGRVNAKVTIVLDDVAAGETIAVCRTKDTTAWKDFAQVTYDLSRVVTGIHDVYVLFYEDGGGAPCNLQYLQFIEAELANTAELDGRLNLVKAKYSALPADENADYKSFLNKFILDMTAKTQKGNITKFEAKQLLAQMDAILKPSHKLEFVFSLIKDINLKGFKEESTYKTGSLILQGYDLLNDKNATGQQLDSMAKSLIESTGVLVPLTACPYNRLDAFSGKPASGSESPTNNGGYLGVLNGTVKMDYGLLNFGDRTARSLEIHYKNVNNKDLAISVYKGSLTGTLLGSATFGQTNEEGAYKSILLSENLAGENQIFLVINSAGGSAGFNSLRFIQNSNQVLLNAKISLALQYDPVLYTEGSYKKLSQCIEKAKKLRFIATHGVDDALIDATIEQLSFFMENLAVKGTKKPYQAMNASTLDVNGGVTARVENDIDEIGSIKNGSYAGYNGFEFGETGSKACIINIACMTELSYVDIKIGSQNGEVVGTAKITTTGGWLEFKPFTIYFSKNLTGAENIYICFRSEAGGDFCNVSSFEFIKADAVGTSFKDGIVANKAKALIENLNITSVFQKPAYDTAKYIYSTLTSSQKAILGSNYDSMTQKLAQQETALNELIGQELKKTNAGLKPQSLTQAELLAVTESVYLDKAYIIQMKAN